MNSRIQHHYHLQTLPFARFRAEHRTVAGVVVCECVCGAGGFCGGVLKNHQSDLILKYSFVPSYSAVPAASWENTPHYPSLLLLIDFNAQ